MFEVAEYIGIIAAAMSGFFVAVRVKLDLLGVLVASFLSALGGGLIRDVIADRRPFAFSHDLPAFVILAVVILLIAFKFHKKDSFENRSIFVLSDSIGLVSFSISGALIAMEANLNFTGVLALAFITAVGGGILRDVIINEVPLLFKTGFYGMVALFMGLSLFILDCFEFVNYYSIGVVFILGVVLRMVAFYKKWSMPLP